MVNHISSPCALPGGPAEGSVLPKQPKVLFPLIGHRSFGCHLRKLSNLSRETCPSRSEGCSKLLGIDSLSGGLVESVGFATCVLWEEIRMRLTGKLHIQLIADISV